MAVVSPVPAIAQGVDSMRFLGARTPRIMASRRELVAESVAEIIEERIFVAVGKNVEKSESTLLWALRNSGGKRICIVHVHRPAQRIPLTNRMTFVCLDYLVRNSEEHLKFFDIVKLNIIFLFTWRYCYHFISYHGLWSRIEKATIKSKYCWIYKKYALELDYDIFRVFNTD